MSKPETDARDESVFSRAFFWLRRKLLSPDEADRKNEIRANLLVANVMAVTAILDLLMTALTFAGLFALERRRMLGALIPGFFLLAIPALLSLRLKGKGNWLKPMLLAACILCSALIELVLPHNAGLCLVLPILLSARYYSGALTACTGLCSALSLLLSSLLSPQSHMGAAELCLFVLITLVCIEIARHGRAVTVQVRETERLETELSLAKTIQENMLPNIFPAFPEREEFDVYARTEPAKELGGDFYDFQMIDRDHLALIIADVAGKGIPAAMFMMASKIIIQSMSKTRSHDPAKILKAVNKQIGANNPADMFVTLWLGILEISTGRLKAANAGHEYPCLRHREDAFRLLKDPHGLVLGALDKTEYRDYELQLAPGDTLFVYTDGVTEAVNAQEEMFGTERLTAALNREPDAPAAQAVDNVRAAMRLFVGDAPPSDDITMLVLKYFGPDGRPDAESAKENSGDA